MNSGVPDAVWLTLRERINSKLPSRLVIVGAQGDGAYYVLDCGRVAADSECPVIVWWPGVSDEEFIDDSEVLATDFGAFFLVRIEAVL
ncbi:SMI1/KNR4 family protein [Pseudomonas mosselii]|uniref:SMI1/KNR4 family protein n=1 Tax=Pseudomonas mosselii TaxID=78327 RepID=UPI003AB62316